MHNCPKCPHPFEAAASCLVQLQCRLMASSSSDTQVISIISISDNHLTFQIIYIVSPSCVNTHQSHPSQMDVQGAIWMLKTGIASVEITNQHL